MANPIRVLIVDDSTYVRLVLSRLLGDDPRFTVVGQASHGLEALALAEELRPDVITLDVEMPKLDGLQVLRRLLPKQPVPVVMLSSLTQRGAQVTLEALSLGAVDFVGKPGGAGVPDLEAVRHQLLHKVSAAAGAQVRPPAAETRHSWQASSRLPVRRRSEGRAAAGKLVVVLIAASTGGPGSLHRLLRPLPEDLPAALAITQHMPPTFTCALAQRLDQTCALQVREASEGEILQPGTAVLAAGGYHLLIGPRGVLHLSSEPPVWGVRPAADPMMLSAAQNLRGPLAAMVLTGMGQDGAQGLAAVKRRGGVTFAESADTAVIFGMPKAAQETGCCDHVLPLDELASQLVQEVERLVMSDDRAPRVAGVGTGAKG